MYGSLFWIEWLDRLDRVLTGIRTDLATLCGTLTPRGLAAMERSSRQLSALTHDLALLDRNVLERGGETDRAGALKKALEETLVHLGQLADIRNADDAGSSGRMIAAAESAVRDSRYEAAMLLEPRRRRA
jgi:hypothetical protein